MTIRRIPIISVLVIALFFAFVVTPFLVEPASTPNPVQIDNFTQDARIESINAYGGFDVDVFISSTFLISFIISLLIISSVFLFIVNNKDIRRYINTSIRLAGYKNSINLLTKKTYINDDVFMEIIRTKSIKMKFLLPFFKNYEEYGFVQQENYVLTTSELENLPLKLRVIKSYLQDNK